MAANSQHKNHERLTALTPTLNRTSTTRMPIPELQDGFGDDESNEDTEDNPSEQIGYQFCENCRNRYRTDAADNAYCGCSKIIRGVAGGMDISSQFDTIIRIAEHALLSAWIDDWQRNEFTITSTIAVGRRRQTGKPDIHDIKVKFSGSLWGDLTEQYTCKFGTAEIGAITDDGALHIDVTLSQETTQ